MPPPRISPALRQFVDEELVRAPMIFDQALAGVADHVRREMATMSSYQRQAAGEMMQAAQAHRARLATRFIESLREQVEGDLARQPQPAALPKTPKATLLALVEEDAVALDVELSHTIQLIKSNAEQELRELRTFIAALVGDMDVAEDHNPFRPEAYARALWAAAQALPLSRGHQVAFMRHAGAPLAQVLRQAYAASCTRLENMGVEPATYRTVIMPGARRSRTSTETTFSPDLQRMRETMPAPLDSRHGTLSYDGQISPGPLQAGARDAAAHPANRADRQSVELVSRLFQAILADDRLPDDVRTMLERLHAPAMRLALRDPSVLDKDEHPLWRFMQVLAYEAEMAPDVADPERVRLLRLGQMLIDKLAAESEQRVSIYRSAQQRLEEFLRQRLERRCAQVASQIGALQKFEATMGDESTVPGALEGVLDEPGIDTVPAELLPTSTTELDGAGDDGLKAASEWLAKLRPGQWVRMLTQGRWVRAQLLHVGDKREAWLFGDGASDATWAVRRGALLKMHASGLAKTLKMRSLVGSAAARVQEQVAALGLA